LFTGLYTGVMNFASFVILQTSWGQDRLIVVYYPLILIFLLGGIYYLFQYKSIRKFFFVYLLLLLILCIGTLSITKNRIGRNFPVLQENMLGNQLDGLTPDWQNFIRGSQWAAQNLDKNAVIVSRKPSISKVYTGRNFVWAPTDITLTSDSLTVMKNTDNQTIVVVSSFFYFSSLKYIISFRDPFPFNNKTSNGAQVYMVPNDDLEEFLLSVQNQKMEFLLDYKSFFDSFGNVDYRIHDPDMMLNYLIENDIRYLLLPQLRVDPTRNTGLYINNVHRFIWFVTCKYPNRFRTIHIEGKEEPCEIVEFMR
jgi:hypothetical protein